MAFERKSFQNRFISSPFVKIHGTLIDQIWITFTPNTLCQVWWKLEWLWSRRILEVGDVLSISSEMEKFTVLYLKKIETYFTQHSLCQISLKLAMWFWRRSFTLVLNIFLVWCGIGQILVEIDPVILKKKWNDIDEHVVF